MKRVADEHGVKGERKTTGTVSENRIRGEQVTGGRDPAGGGSQGGEESFLLFNPRVAAYRAERRVGIRTH